MDDVLQIAPTNALRFELSAAESIARETATPIELASRIYKEELEALARNARITQFLHVIATRRTCLRLRRHRMQ